MNKIKNLYPEYFPGEHALDEVIRKVGQGRLRHSLLVQKLYPQTEEEFQQQRQFAKDLMSKKP